LTDEHGRSMFDTRHRSVIKTIPIHESMDVQFRTEFFNIFYNVNSLLPVNDISSPKFT
jgi:hypothetical protein